MSAASNVNIGAAVPASLISSVQNTEQSLQALTPQTEEASGSETIRQANRDTRAGIAGDMATSMSVLGALTVPVTVAVKFESQMADLEPALNLSAPGAFKEVQKDILGITAQVPMAVGGITAIYDAAGRSGIAKGRKELSAFATDAAHMGVAFKLNGAVAGKMMADWRKGMKLSQAQAVTLAGAVSHLSDSTGVQAGELGAVIQAQGAAAVAAGLTEIQTAGLSAAFLSSGASPKAAAAGLKDLTGALTAGKNATDAQKKGFSALKLDAAEMATMMQKDAPGAVQKMLQALNKLPKGKQESVAKQLFGKSSSAAVMGLAGNIEELPKALELVSNATNYADAMQKAYERRAGTTAAGFAVLRNQGTRLGVSLGAVLLPAVNTLITPIGAVLDTAASLAQEFPGLTTVVMGAGLVLAALPPLLLFVKFGLTMVSDAASFSRDAFGALRKGVGRAAVKLKGFALVQNLVGTASKALAATQVVLGAVMAGAFGPVGLVVGAVALAVAGAGLLIWKYWKPIKAFFTGFAKGVMAALAPIGQALMSILAPVGKALAPIGQALKSMLAPIAGFMGRIKGLLFSQSEQGVTAAASLGERIGSTIGGAIKLVIMNLTPVGWFIKAFSAVKTFLTTIDFSGPGASIVKTLVAGIMSVAMKPLKAIKGIFAKVKGFFPGFGKEEVPKPGPLPKTKLSANDVAEAVFKAKAGAGNRAKEVTGELTPVSPAASGPVPPVSGHSSPGPEVSQARENNISVNFNPTITVAGQTPEEARKEVNDCLVTCEQRLRQMLEEIVNQDRRLSYA